MLKRVLIYIALVALGFAGGWWLFSQPVELLTPANLISETATLVGLVKSQSIGFMPYWLLDKADKDYSRYLTEMTYFALIVEPDGTIQKFTNPGEAEPGWYALQSGKFSPPAGVATSLAVFNGNPDKIDELINDPINHARVLAEELKPVMGQYGFTKLNLDLENVRDASESARQNFTAFVRQLKENLGYPLTIDASPTDLVKTRLINLTEVVPLVEQVVLMTYDYHYAGSFVTGPVSPSFGAGIENEFDVETGIQKALAVMPAKKILLGMPLYGYEWETLLPDRRAAVLPGSGIVASNRRVEEFLAECATCSRQLEESAQEPYLVYFDQEAGTHHQIFYPDEAFVKAKLALAKKYHLGGVAFWALGYDGNNILSPVAGYLK